MVLAVVQRTDPITHSGRSFDPSSDDLITNFVTEYLLAQVRHDRLLENRTITDDRAISAQDGSVAEKRGAVARPRRQLTSNRPICSVQKVVQTIPVDWLTWPDNARQRRRIDGRQPPDRREISGNGTIPQDRTVTTG